LHTRFESNDRFSSTPADSSCSANFVRGGKQSTEPIR
jgi:hypothetical protein